MILQIKNHHPLSFTEFYGKLAAAELIAEISSGIMKRVCGWCNTVIGSVPSKWVAEAIITHGICDECMLEMLKPLSDTLMDFLDSMDAPVLVVDACGTMRSANKQARSLLQKELPDIKGFTGGVVFECAYADLPEGCGHTIHCSGCTIRNTVMDTLSSGMSHLNMPASLIRGTSDGKTEIPLLITTEKVKDFVLLRIGKTGSSQTV